MNRFYRLLVFGLLLVLTACLPGAGASTGIAPSGVGTASVTTALPAVVATLPADFTPPPASVPPANTPIPTLSGGLGPAELAYRILEQFPDFFYCDRDFYPIARADEKDLALQRFPDIQANSEGFNAILAHNQLSGQSTFSDEQKLLIYQAHKKLAAIPLTLANAAYQFQIQVAKTEGQGEIITGQIDRQGKITIQERKPSIATCPICLAAGTLIDTPSGPIPVEALQVGVMVWTLNRAGERLPAPVVETGKTMVPANHQVVHLVLMDGRELWVSPGHPTIDGRRIGQLRVNDSLDGSMIKSVEHVPYTNSATYDLLPAGETGFYWANGILIASTLNGE